MDTSLAVRRAQMLSGFSTSAVARGMGSGVRAAQILRSRTRAPGEATLQRFCAALGAPRALLVLLGITGAELAELPEDERRALIGVTRSMAKRFGGFARADTLGEAIRCSVLEAQGKRWNTPAPVRGLVAAHEPWPRRPAQPRKPRLADRLEREIRHLGPMTLDELTDRIRWNGGNPIADTPEERGAILRTIRSSLAAMVRTGRAKRGADGRFAVPEAAPLTPIGPRKVELNTALRRAVAQHLGDAPARADLADLLVSAGVKPDAAAALAARAEAIGSNAVLLTELAASARLYAAGDGPAALQGMTGNLRRLCEDIAVELTRADPPPDGPAPAQGCGQDLVSEDHGYPPSHADKDESEAPSRASNCHVSCRGGLDDGGGRGAGCVGGPHTCTHNVGVKDGLTRGEVPCQGGVGMSFDTSEGRAVDTTLREVTQLGMRGRVIESAYAMGEARYLVRWHDGGTNSWCTGDEIEFVGAPSTGSQEPVEQRGDDNR